MELLGYPVMLLQDHKLLFRCIIIFCVSEITRERFKYVLNEIISIKRV